MVTKGYFYVQHLTFSLCGFDTKAVRPEIIVKRPFQCYVPLVFAIAHFISMIHYAYVNRHNYVEVTDTLALSCQSLLAIWKVLIFLVKREQIVEMIKTIHLGNFKAADKELEMIIAENVKDVKFCRIYFWSVIIAVLIAFGSPVVEALYIYYETEKLVLRVPYKGSYPWPHVDLTGYFLIYIWNVLSIYSLISITLAFDTLFTWLVSNISAQFHILYYRFNEAAKSFSDPTSSNANESNEIPKAIKSCLKYHKHTIQLTAKLNQVYGEIIFVKFLISCLEICCLAFRLSFPSESMVTAGYQCLFLATVAVQLMLYCYNGQRISDKSLQVSPEIYLAFDWSQLPISCKKLLLLSVMRSQNSSQVKGVFFDLNLNLFLWAFKTAASLITALKTLEENKD